MFFHRKMHYGLINKWQHLAIAKPAHLLRWSPQRWPGAARQRSPCRRNLRLHDWTQSCCHLLLQNQAQSSPTPDENQRTSSWCRSDGRGVLISDEQLVPCAMNYFTDDDAGQIGNLNDPCINRLEHTTMQKCLSLLRRCWDNPDFWANIHLLAKASQLVRAVVARCYVSELHTTGSWSISGESISLVIHPAVHDWLLLLITVGTSASRPASAKLAKC